MSKPSNYELEQKISKEFCPFTQNCSGPHNNENKLQVDENQNKLGKVQKRLKTDENRVGNYQL